MAERVLTTRELNRAVLARQLLLERAALPPEEAAARVAGLQTQYAPSGYIGMWSRLSAFGRVDLTDALLQQRMIQAWVMRCTIHMVAAADYWAFTEAVRVPRREWWLRVTKAASDEEVAWAAEAVRGYLADGPLKQAQIQKLLVGDGFRREVWPGVQLWVDLVRVPPAGTWGTPRAHVYGLAEHSVAPPQAVPSEKEAQELLAERYLAAFGPASAADIASFCGWPITIAKSVLERLDLRRFRDETGGELVDVPGAPLPSAGTPAPVRFLGQWDANLLAHVRRAQILPEEHRSKVFATTMPQSVPTFLVDGQVAGTWRFIDGAVPCEPFGELPPGAAAAVAEEAERLAAFHSG
jgi:hypothetical protein